jgi:hypothetical protein
VGQVHVAAWVTFALPMTPPYWQAIADRLTTLLDEVAARYGP